MGVSRKAIVYRGRAFYAGANDAAGQIMVFDGTVERELCRLVNGPATSSGTGAGIGGLGLAGQKLYVPLSDGTTMRLFEVDIETGASSVVGTGLVVANEFITHTIMHNGKLFVATAGRSNTNVSHIYSLKPGVDTTWTTERTTADLGGGKYYQYSHMCSFGGRLYAATTAPAGFAAVIERLNADLTWSTELTSAETTNSNFYDSFAVFQGVLYAMFGSTTPAFTVVKQTAVGTWTTDKDMAAAGSTSVSGFRVTTNTLLASAPPRVFAKTSGSWTTVLSSASITNGMLL